MFAMSRSGASQARTRVRGGSRTIGLVAACLFGLGLAGPHPARADVPPELKLCPPSVVKTCFIGYVTAASKIVVILSSVDNDPLVGAEIEVAATPPEAAAIENSILPSTSAAS